MGNARLGKRFLVSFVEPVRNFGASVRFGSKADASSGPEGSFAIKALTQSETHGFRERRAKLRLILALGGD